uniref:Uncharacterized protein n=1 Tax=Anguilla anguilla TaxID=7936 RepID=A0A0E9UUA3_ANGAN
MHAVKLPMKICPKDSDNLTVKGFQIAIQYCN